jgi:TatD DNase family protein
VGIHPEDAQKSDDIDAELSALDELLAHKGEHKIVALGEIGFDYYWQPVDKELQAKTFEAQMKLAQKHGLPVVVHDREAHGDSFDMICKFPKVRGVFHSYSGSAEMARELTRRGWYISFSGTLTFKNANRVREAALAVPRDRLLIETDAPYLAPHPMRGRLNHSGLLVHTLDSLATLWEISAEEVAKITFTNAKKCFDISGFEQNAQKSE